MLMHTAGPVGPAAVTEGDLAPLEVAEERLLRLSGATSIAAALRHHSARTERPVALLLTS